MATTYEIPVSVSTVIQLTNTPHSKDDCHFNSIMNCPSFDFFHTKPISSLQKEGVEHTDTCETNSASVQRAKKPIALPWGRGDDIWPWCWALAVGTEGSRHLPRTGEQLPKPGGPQSTHCKAQSCLSSAHTSLALLALTMQHLPTHLRSLSGFNTNRPGIFWFCLFFSLPFLLSQYCHEVISQPIFTFYSIFFWSCIFHDLFMQDDKWQIHWGFKQWSELASLC